MFDKKGWRDFAASVSLANLMFLKLWLKLLPYRQANDYLAPYSPFNSYLAAMLNVLIWGGLLFLGVRIGRKRPGLFPWVALLIFFLVGVLAVYGAGASVISFARFVFLFGHKNALLVESSCWVAAVSVVVLLVYQRERVARLYQVLPLLVSPFLLVTFGEASAALMRLEPAAHFHPHSFERLLQGEGHLPLKVVWIIFDETDYRLCFQERPPQLSLPSFDRFRENAFWATRAYSPSDATQVSLPSLLTGIPLKTTLPVSAARIDLVRADNGERLDFSRQDNIFADIRSRRGSSALFGWYHPYGRILPQAQICRDYPRYNFWTSDSLLEVLLHQPLEIADLRFLTFSNTILGENQIGIVKRMQADVIDALRRENPDFMFLHYSVPHSPNIYDRSTGSFGFNRNKREGYLDNVALADRLFGELRREMEKKGSWDGALVVVSSDHHWRTNTYDGKTDFEHVPFMVKFPHQREGVTYQRSFNTVVTKELILSVVDGKVKSAEDAAAWLDGKTRRGPYSRVIFSRNQPDAD